MACDIKVLLQVIFSVIYEQYSSCVIILYCPSYSGFALLMQSVVEGASLLVICIVIL